MSPRNYLNLKGEKMPIKLKEFSTTDYFNVCGMNMRTFAAGAKRGVKIDYHHPTGVMVHRDGKKPEFIPIHNIRTVTPENIEDLQAVLGVAPKKEAPVIDGLDGPISDAPKRKRRTKAEMEAARVAAS